MVSGEYLTGVHKPGSIPSTVNTTQQQEKNLWAQRYFQRNIGNNLNISIGKEELCCNVVESNYKFIICNYSKASCIQEKLQSV